MTESIEQRGVFAQGNLTTQRGSSSLRSLFQARFIQKFNAMGIDKRHGEPARTKYLPRDGSLAPRALDPRSLEVSSDDKVSISNDVKQLKEMTCNVLARVVHFEESVFQKGRAASKQIMSKKPSLKGRLTSLAGHRSILSTPNVLPYKAGNVLVNSATIARLTFLQHDPPEQKNVYKLRRVSLKTFGG